ncbi:MAG TPA: hypothetical protein VHV27_07520 [Phenylobacterium sp.]|jgi:hypothetical protein|nr:hypothetical protein [Phenylobacterium sp.]
MLGLLFAVAAAQTAGAGPAQNTIEGLNVVAPKMVAELRVMPHAACLDAKRDFSIPPPKIVSTFPQRGAVVRPGVLLVRITFDRPMTCAGFLQEDQPLLDPCSPKLQTFVLSFDRRTVRTICVAAPKSHFGLWLNRGAPGPALFQSLAGWTPTSYELTFSTSDEPLATSVRDALVQDPESRKRLGAASSSTPRP